MTIAKFGSLELTDDGKLVLGVSLVDVSRAMEAVTMPLVDIATRSGKILDIDKYLPVMKQRVAQLLFMDHEDIRDIIKDMPGPENALQKYDDSLAAGLKEFGIFYDENFGDDTQPDERKRARYVLSRINEILISASQNKIIRHELSLLKNP